ncbi:DUF1254 domain-containing protein [Hansschlegelia quercus]|uniref:DUF1254 domain-containing protein n=1 Tax=Hansschlegelia quercus TaxID=2528245 RepID=UPI001FDF3E0A|nr:DUF1254 domain-containing protein [Hansschlegelia quercus]
MAFLALAAPTVDVRAEQASPIDCRTIAKEAYIYAFAPMENYNTWRKQAVDSSAPEYVGGFNVFRHYSEPFTPDNHDVVTPNNDTPYSWAWLDLRAEPVVVSVPAVPKDRYYVLQLFDVFTFNFAYIGVRSTGFEAGDYMIAGPRWTGETPKRVTKVFRSETDIVGILGRTALNGPEDVPNVKAIQADIKVTPLSAFLGTKAPPAAASIDFPPYEPSKAATHDFIGYLNFLLQFAQPADPSETALLARFATIGIVPGKAFDPTTIDPKLLADIDAGVRDAQAELHEREAQTLTANGLFGTRAFLKNDYMKRAVGAAKGLYGNSLEEAWYGGFIGNGSKPSVMRFAAGELPPAKFFWSATLYTLPDRFLYANELDRYSVGDRTKGLVFDKDGSLTITISHDAPSADKKANWLPAPAGLYSLVVRAYGPSEEMMTSKWKLPPLQTAAP